MGPSTSAQPPSTNGRTPTLPNAERLWDEFKLLQGKLDKIGDFRFKVKGWAITLILGLSVATIAAKVPWYGMFPSLVLVVGFQLFEGYHMSTHHAFTKRIGQIERILEKSGGETFPSPQIRAALAEQRRALRRRPWRKGWRKPIGSIVESWNWLRVRANGVFYLLLYLLVTSVALIAKLQHSP